VEVAVIRQQDASGHGGNLCRSNSHYHRGTSLSMRLGSTGKLLLALGRWRKRHGFAVQQESGLMTTASSDDGGGRFCAFGQVQCHEMLSSQITVLRLHSPQPCQVHPLQVWLEPHEPRSAHRWRALCCAPRRRQLRSHPSHRPGGPADVAVRCADGHKMHLVRCLHVVCAKQATRFKSMRSPAVFVLCSLVRWPAAAEHVVPCSSFRLLEIQSDALCVLRSIRSAEADAQERLDVWFGRLLCFFKPPCPHARCAAC